VNEYLTFRRMITPVFIQVIFWIAVAAIVIGGIVALANGEGAGILIIIFGPLAARIYAELLIVIFRINDNVAAIRHQWEGAAPVPPGGIG
jgi:hypothetical protein